MAVPAEWIDVYTSFFCPLYQFGFSKTGESYQEVETCLLSGQGNSIDFT